MSDNVTVLPSAAAMNRKKRVREDDRDRKADSIVCGTSSTNSFDQQIIKSMPTTDADCFEAILFPKVTCFDAQGARLFANTTGMESVTRHNVLIDI